MRLIRNTTPDGTCKYGLVRLDKLRKMEAGQQVALMRHIEVLKAAGLFEFAGKNDPEEAFTIKLKDVHAPAALLAYSEAAKFGEHRDQELSDDVYDLASRAERHPNRKKPD